MCSPPSKWALITGVSEGGLGDALTAELLSNGVNVIATTLEMSLLDYLQPTGGPHTRLAKVQLDLTALSSIAAAVTATKAITGGQLDLLINNAGYGYMTSFLDASPEKIQANFAVNVFGLLSVTQAFFPLLRAAKGTVVNQSSIAGMNGICQPFIGVYSATKMCVTDLSNTMRVEFEPFDVKVVTLFTGDVRTQFWQRGEERVLPEDSPYALMKDQAQAMMRGDTNPPGQHTPRRWARAVAKDLLKKSPPAAVRRGFLAETMWWISMLWPIWLLDWMFWQNCKFGEFTKKLQAEESKKDI